MIYLVHDMVSPFCNTTLHHETAVSSMVPVLLKVLQALALVLRQGKETLECLNSPKVRELY